MTATRRWLGCAAALALAACGDGGKDPGWSIGGTVTGAAGTSVAVVLTGTGLTGALRTQSDLSGRYAFHGVAPGEYQVTPELAGYAFTPATAQVALHDGSRQGLDFAASPRSVLQVWGADMGAWFQNVNVMRDGAPVSDAVVTVNGLVIPPVPLLPGSYHADLAAPIPVGGAVALVVTSGGLTVTGEATVPPVPTLVAPADGAALAPGADLAVEWLCGTSPDRFVVALSWSCGADCSTGTARELAGSARAATIPSAVLPARGPLYVTVYAYSLGSLAGDYAAFPIYPGMNVRNESATATVLR